MEKKRAKEIIDRLKEKKFLQNDKEAEGVYQRIEKELKEAQKKNEELLQILRNLIFSC